MTRAAGQSSRVPALAVTLPEPEAAVSDVRGEAGEPGASAVGDLHIGGAEAANMDFKPMQNTGPGAVTYHGIANPFSAMEMPMVERSESPMSEQIIVEVTREEPVAKDPKSVSRSLPPDRMDESLRNQLATTTEFSNPLTNRPPWERTDRVFSWEIDLADKN